MLKIEPESVELTVFSQNLDQLGRQELPQTEDADRLALTKHLLDSRHPNTSLTRATIGQ